MVDTPQKDNIPMAGTFGNLSVGRGGMTLAAAAIGTKIYFCKIPGGSTLVDAHMINAALGASSTIALGLEYCDGSSGGVSGTAVVAAAASTAAAGRVNMGLKPIEINKDMYLVGTTAGAVTSGAVDAVFKYSYNGQA
jgi:hypothetical protein